MEHKISPAKGISAALFAAFLLIGFIKNGSFTTLSSLSDFLKQPEYNTADAVSIDSIESDFSDAIWKKNDFINLNGLMAKTLNMHGFYSDMGMYITDDNYIVSASEKTTGDYEFAELTDFRDFLESNGINLLYVNKPTKYLDDSLFRNSFGIETYSNRNMDSFIQRIREAGIPAIDLRENIMEEGLNISDMFYRTDHHWTVPAALWATGIIAKALNDNCGYDIDLSVYDPKNFTEQKWTSCWLGEQGRKVAETYVGLDDYTLLQPAYPTSFTFKEKDGTTHDGAFDGFINEYVLNTENDVYENLTWHYAFSSIDNINHNAEKGKVLIIGDSYDTVTHAFLSLGIHETDLIVLRDRTFEGTARDYILKNGYDTVIVAYAQFMLGAHDDETNANRFMYAFDQ